MDEDELEQAMRDGLQRRVAEADVAERSGPLVARAREAARSGRQHKRPSRWNYRAVSGSLLKQW